MPTSASTLQEEASIDEFFNLAATETLALFEHLRFDFLEEFDVFAPRERGRTRDHHPPELFRAFLHCYYKDIYGIRPVARELQNTIVWLSCGFDLAVSPTGLASSYFLTQHPLTAIEVRSLSDTEYSSIAEETDIDLSRFELIQIGRGPSNLQNRSLSEFE